jgi:hypothetical protein
VTKWNQPTGVIGGSKQSRAWPFICNTFSEILRYSLPEQCHVLIRCYNMCGRLVNVLVNSIQQSGEHRVSLPSGLAAGSYIVSFKAGERKINKVVMIAR